MIISDLIRSSGSFHIIKLLGKRGDERHLVEQTRVRHILIKPDEVNTDEEVKVRIEQLEIRLRGGEDFETLALANSQDTLSAAKGGDLGWINQGDTVPEFEEAMNSLAPGELSKPVKIRVRLAPDTGTGTPYSRQHRRIRTLQGQEPDSQQEIRGGIISLAAAPA